MAGAPVSGWSVFHPAAVVVLVVALFHCRPGDLVGRFFPAGVAPAVFTVLVLIESGVVRLFVNFLRVLRQVVADAARQFGTAVVRHFRHLLVRMMHRLPAARLWCRLQSVLFVLISFGSVAVGFARQLSGKRVPEILTFEMGARHVDGAAEDVASHGDGQDEEHERAAANQESGRVPERQHAAEDGEHRPERAGFRGGVHALQRVMEAQHADDGPRQEQQAQRQAGERHDVQNERHRFLPLCRCRNTPTATVPTKLKAATPRPTSRNSRRPYMMLTIERRATTSPVSMSSATNRSATSGPLSMRYITPARNSITSTASTDATWLRKAVRSAIAPPVPAASVRNCPRCPAVFPFRLPPAGRGCTACSGHR